MQVTFSALLKGAGVLKSAGTVSDKFNSLAVYHARLSYPSHYHTRMSRYATTGQYQNCRHPGANERHAGA